MCSQINLRKQIYDNSILVADGSGCTLIESRHINATTSNSLIELQEDIWYYCLDTLKMTTYEIICLKKYLSDTGMLPIALTKQLPTIL